MRPGICAKNMPKWVLLVLFVLFLQPFALAQTDEPDVSREADGGHSILLEQYTATWCDSCAVVDRGLLISSMHIQPELCEWPCTPMITTHSAAH